MKLWKKIVSKDIEYKQHKSMNVGQDDRRVTVLYNLLADIYGADQLVLKAGKVQALKGMRSSNIDDRVMALQRIVYEDPTIERAKREDIPEILDNIEDEIANLHARKQVEDDIEKRVAQHMQERHEEYVQEIRMQVLKEENGPENDSTQKKLAQLKAMEEVHLTRTTYEIIRPRSLQEVIGQEKAIKALLANIASPYPQHVILYGPPGVGKTTVARLVLEQAKKMKHTPFALTAPFIEVDGTTLRWDSREVTNPLLGSVHDPIYQGARRELAESGIPEPKLGLVSEAHGGILFLDEIGELDPLLQNKLLKVLEDKKVTFESSYYDSQDPNIPAYIKHLFDEGAPADFILIGATTNDPENISPALRSRSQEIYFEPLSPKEVADIVKQAAIKLEVSLEDGVAEMIAEYTSEGRKATHVLADAYGAALYNRSDDEVITITRNDIQEVAATSRMSAIMHHKASSEPKIARIYGLGVAGFVGSVLEIESVTFRARERGKGAIRFNETAGTMAKDSVFNAYSAIRKVTDQDLYDYDVHVNIIGGGKIDGPSAGLAIFLTLFSAVKGQALRQDIAITGEISLQGEVKPVGGISEKIYGAKQAGMNKVLIPYDNRLDVPLDISGIEVVLVKDVDEALKIVLVE